MKELAITATNCITAIGHDAVMTAAAVRAGITRFYEYEEYLDREENPVTVAKIRGIADERDAIERMAEAAALCLENLLTGYSRDVSRKFGRIHLLLGAASEHRPGPRYEDNCIWSLNGILENRAAKTTLETFPMGNAALPYALEEAGSALANNPDILCIVGCIDSLLRDSTLNFFEQDNRLKSVSHGRHQGLIAGEAVCFMIVEDPARARQSKIPILARITGIGLAQEPEPRAFGCSGRGAGLSEACRAALSGKSDDEISVVFGDLNGENLRALEWSMTEKNCFRNRNGRKIWTPANCYGDVGAASGAVMSSVAAHGFVRGWLQGPALVFCSDDHGSCGAVVLENWTLDRQMIFQEVFVHGQVNSLREQSGDIKHR